MNQQVFRSRFNIIGAVVVWLLCAGAVWAVLASGAAGNLEFLAPIALAAWLAWMGLAQPRVVVTDAGTRLVNVLSTVDVPWEALIQVDTKYALVLRTPHGAYTATAAPAPGRLGATMTRSDVLPGTRRGERVRPGDSPRTDSGAAAFLVRDRWARLSESGRIDVGVADSTPVLRRWHWASITAGLALAVASVLLLALV